MAKPTSNNVLMEASRLTGQRRICQSATVTLAHPKGTQVHVWDLHGSKKEVLVLIQRNRAFRRVKKVPGSFRHIVAHYRKRAE